MKPSFDPWSVPNARVPRRLVSACLLAVAVGVVLLAVSGFISPLRTLYAYLTAFCDVLTIALGALVLLLIVHAMNAGWPVPLRRLLEAMVSVLVPLAVAFLPIAIFVDPIYPWVEPAVRLPHHAQEVLHKKEAYLDVTFFWVRAVAYWASWLIVGWRLLAWSKLQDTSLDANLRVRQRVLSAATLPLVGLTFTFAAFDWMMSLDPVWFSSIYGLDVFAGGFEAAIGLLTVIVVLCDRAGLLPGLINDSHYYALGRLLLAFVIFWGYIIFFQFFLIWIGNRPEEVAYYLRRLDGGWWVVALVIGIGHFVVPFLVLLSYRIKRRPERLIFVGAWMVLMHLIDVHWKIVPALDDAAILHLADLGALLLLGGGAVAWVARRLEGRPIAPRHDPMLPRGTRYHSE